MTIRWSIQVGDRVVPETAEEVDLTGLKLTSTEEAARYASCFPNITKLNLTDCGLDNETLAAFREEKRAEYKVVWTVYLGSICKARTDDTKFMPLTQGDGYFRDWNAVDLKYCEDMIAIDIGHSRVRNIDFVAYMPHLKYLILADTDVRDLTPISNCKELIWLERASAGLHRPGGCEPEPHLCRSGACQENDLAEEPLVHGAWQRRCLRVDTGSAQHPCGGDRHRRHWLRLAEAPQLLQDAGRFGYVLYGLITFL